MRPDNGTRGSVGTRASTSTSRPNPAPPPTPDDDRIESIVGVRTKKMRQATGQVVSIIQYVIAIA